MHSKDLGDLRFYHIDSVSFPTYCYILDHYKKKKKGPKEMICWNVYFIYMFLFLTHAQWVSFKNLIYYATENGYGTLIYSLLDMLRK